MSEMGCLTEATLRRVGYLTDPSTLDALLDEFAKQGMPMGSSRWAEYCRALLRQREEEAKALRRVMRCLQDAIETRDKANDLFWIEKRHKLTMELQKQGGGGE